MPTRIMEASRQLSGLFAMLAAVLAGVGYTNKDHEPEMIQMRQDIVQLKQVDSLRGKQIEQLDLKLGQLTALIRLTCIKNQQDATTQIVLSCARYPVDVQ